MLLQCACPHCYEISGYPALANAAILVTTCRFCREIIAVLPGDKNKKEKPIAIPFNAQRVGSLTLEKQKYMRSIIMGEDSEVNPNIFSEDFINYINELKPPISQAEEEDFRSKLNDPNFLKNLQGDGYEKS